MFGTFWDITYDTEANEAACEFIRRKIAQIVKDSEKERIRWGIRTFSQKHF
jgi:hypothetical protein